MNESRKIIEVILKLVEDSYRSSEQERKKLHNKEWEEFADSPSILGETEIRADVIIGYVKCYIKEGLKRDDEVISVLHKYRIMNSKALSLWLLNERFNYPNFTLYLHHLEYLGLTLYCILLME